MTDVVSVRPQFRSGRDVRGGTSGTVPGWWWVDLSRLDPRWVIYLLGKWSFRGASLGDHTPHNKAYVVEVSFPVVLSGHSCAGRRPVGIEVVPLC